MKSHRSHEQAPDNGGLGAVGVDGGEQLRQPVAQILHFPVQAPYVVACLLQHLRRRHLSRKHSFRIY
ncbi:unnamed protein product [Linum trigynum]|uniref:Uncharacterized protein n=1 Tax=Linum trigynum TaxID=586398 RepID=A0AAV2CQ35_9ROSI